MSELEKALAELAWLAARGHSPPEWRFCEDASCGRAFLPGRSDQRYCCQRCKNRVAVRRYRQ